MTYLLDTNVCIELIDGRSRKVRARFLREVNRNATFTTSAIVVHELWYGVAKSKQVEQNARAVSAFLSRDIALLDYSGQDGRISGEIRSELERQGLHIGEYDTLIAGQALARNLILVTANSRGVARVKGLVVEDWTV